MTKEETAGIPFPPPSIPFVLFVVTAALHLALPVVRWPDSSLRWLGWIPIVLGFLLASAALRALRRADTPVDPDQPVRALVVDGPYAWVRNPIYLAFCVLYFGLVWVLGWWLGLILFLALPLLLTSLVIAREERYLGRLFGEKYEAYRSRVRRWGIFE